MYTAFSDLGNSYLLFAIYNADPQEENSVYLGRILTDSRILAVQMLRKINITWQGGNS